MTATRWRLPSGEKVDLDVSVKEVEELLAISARLSGVEEEAAAEEEAVLAQFESAEADGLDEDSAQLHLAAMAELRRRGIEDPTNEQYAAVAEAIQADTLTAVPPPRPWKAKTPPPEVGKTRTRPDGTPPARKVVVDENGRPTRNGQLWSEADEYARHVRALEILGRTDLAGVNPDDYAQALEQARKEQEANR